MNSRHLSILLCGSVFLAAADMTATEQSVSEEQLEKACASLQRASFEASGLRVLLDVSRQTDYAPAFRSRAMAAYSLTRLMQGNTNAFERALQILHATYPDDASALVTVASADAFLTCDACAGSGVQTTLCPSCMGTGKCKTCAGTGKKAAAVCAVCKGKEICAMCAGHQKIETPCPTCKGTRLVFKPSEKMRDNYMKLLSAMVTACQENRTFADEYRLASREGDTDKRIALLQALLQTFSKRPDLLGPAQNLLEAAVKARNEKETIRLKREAREKEDREVEALRSLRETKAPPAAIATLDAYLKAHPRTSALTELQTLKEELCAKRDRATLTKHVLYGVAALLGVLFVIGCLKPLLFRKKAQSLSALPGMDKLNKADFTDPLTLTAAESKSRDKTKTGQILPAEKR